MNFLFTQLVPLSPFEETVLFLLKTLKVKVTRKALHKTLTEHPNYPSLLSISDALTNYGVKNAALTIPLLEWDENLNTPFIALVKNEEKTSSSFYVIKAITPNAIEYYNPRQRKIISMEIEKFTDIYLGTVMAVEADEFSTEPNYKQNKITEKQAFYLFSFSLLVIPLFFVAESVLLLYNSPSSTNWHVATFSIFTIIGLVLALLLLLTEVNEYIPLAKMVCEKSKKINCTAIINSKASKILGLSWSEIGTTYFFGMIFVLLHGGLFSQPVFSGLTLLNLLSLPVVVFSIFYQWRIAKQWCILCVGVQIILVCQLIVACTMPGAYRLMQIPASVYLTMLYPFVITLIFIHYLINILKKQKDKAMVALHWQRLKYDPVVFQSFLIKERNVPLRPSALGITLGNQDAENFVIVASNPYCQPCAEAHPELDALLNYHNNLAIHIIFSATNDLRDSRRLPVMHLLSIASRGNASLTRKALSDWYEMAITGYESFANKYPLEEDLEKYAPVITEMENWCNQALVNSTPMIFINGYKMPSMYQLSELRQLFLSLIPQ